MWLYWENLAGRQTPAHIALCHEALRIWCGADLDIQILDRQAVLERLPEASHHVERLREPAHVADYARVALLAEYGGMWLDSDSICFRSLQPLAELLEIYDFVAYEYRSGTNGKRKTYRVPIGFLATRPHSELFATWKRSIEAALDAVNPNGQSPTKPLGPRRLHQSDPPAAAGGEFAWHALGRDILEPLLRDYDSTNRLSYQAIPAESHCSPIKCKQRAAFFTKVPLRTILHDSPLQPFVFYFNSWMPELARMSAKDLLKGRTVICRLFQYALQPERREELLNL